MWSIYVSNTQIIANQKASMLLTSLSNYGFVICFPITRENGFNLYLNTGVSLSGCIIDN